MHGAGEGNRTLVVSLEGFCSTIELHPHLAACCPVNGRRPKLKLKHIILVEGEGFEPSKAEPSDLQSDPFDRSGTPPNKAEHYEGFLNFRQIIEQLNKSVWRHGAHVARLS